MVKVPRDEEGLKLMLMYSGTLLGFLNGLYKIWRKAEFTMEKKLITFNTWKDLNA